MQHSSNFIVCIKIHLDCLWLMWSSSYDSFGLDRNRNVGQESPLLCSCFCLHCQHKLMRKLEDLAQQKCSSEMMSCCGAPTFLFLSIVGITSKGCMTEGRRQWRRQRSVSIMLICIDCWLWFWFTMCYSYAELEQLLGISDTMESKRPFHKAAPGSVGLKYSQPAGQV